MTPLARKSFGFAAFLAACLAVEWSAVSRVVRLSLAEDTYSHIVLIPFITIALIWMNKGRTRVWTGSNPRSAAALLLAGALLFSMSGRLGQLIPGDDPLPFAILALVLLVWAGILFFFGAA